MKLCPQCKRTYADESLTFCLADGALLSAPYDPDATQFLPSPGEIHPTIAAARVNVRGRRFTASFAVILVMAVLLTGTAVALFYERAQEHSNSSSKQLGSGTPISSPTAPEQTVNPTPPLANDQKRYVVTKCNSIKDAQTGLEWFVGPDRNMTWYEAEQWTGNLEDCAGGWRMPTSEEIKTLYNPAVKAGIGYYTSGKYFPAHIDPVFDAIGGGSWVWANQKLGDAARSFNLNQGKVVTYSAMNTLYSTRAFAVRNLRN